MLGDRPHMEVAYSTLFSLPGTPVMRYGDEIGMGDDLTLNERDAVRTPMQWTAERNGGFSTAEKTFLPAISEGVWSYEHVNVEAQRRDPNSLLRWTGHMVRLRKECPEIGWGKYEILDPGCREILAIRYDWQGSSLLILHNFDAHPHIAYLDIGLAGYDRLSDLINDDVVSVSRSGKVEVAVAAFGYRWFRIGPLNYALQRNGP